MRNDDRMATVVEGRMTMVDFSNDSGRVRIEPEEGPAVYGTFDAEMRGRMYANILRTVRAYGVPERDNGPESPMTIHIDRLEPVADNGEYPAQGSFWRLRTLEDMIREQGVKPVENFDEFMGGWPEDELDDGFEQAYRQWREAGLKDEQDA